MADRSSARATPTRNAPRPVQRAAPDPRAAGKKSKTKPADAAVLDQMLPVRAGSKKRKTIVGEERTAGEEAAPDAAPDAEPAVAGTPNRHLTIQTIDKMNFPSLMVKFVLAHKLQWAELDPVTNLILMLRTGEYGLGADLRSRRRRPSVHAALQAIFGTDNDDEVVRVFELNRSSLLPSIRILRQCTLRELSAMRDNGLRLPERLLRGATPERR